MKLKEVYNIIDALAPFALSREYCEKYGMYDNSGLLVDCGNEINGIFFSLDGSMEAVEEAKKMNADLLITHHPAIYSPIKELSASNPVTECAKAGISVISAHLNLDSAQGGIDDCLAQGLGAKGKIHKMHTLSCGGYGSVFEISATPLAEFVQRAKAQFCTERVMAYGDRPVKKVASFCGGGMNEETVAYALEQGADTLVSSDPKHHLILEAVAKNMNVLILTHYAAENYGFYKFYQKIEEKCPLVPMAYFEDERLM